MKIRTVLIGTVILLGAWILGAADHKPAAKSRISPRTAVLAARASDNECLACHDNFDKLIESTGGYQAPSGEKGSPHRYVPHDSKKKEDIPECTHCHKAHAMDPLPKKGSLDKSKVGIQWCFEACHHEKTLESCKHCHP
jgi:hypothetical protein